MSHLRITTIGLFLGLVSFSQSAVAQPLGSFRWQVQPYCNVLTLNVVQQAGIYTLDGTDDLCGGTQKASVVGIASLNPSGTVGFGMTLVLPGGTPVHIEATINMTSLNGTWRDSAGNSGTMIFTPGPGIAGAPRPVPSGGIAPASITNIQLATNSVSGTNIVDNSITTADILDGPRAAFEGDDQTLVLTATDAIVRAVTITAPAAGRVVVNASGYFWFVSNATAETARCSITTSAAIDSSHLILDGETTAAATTFTSFAGTRGFSVAAGSHTFNLVCDSNGGTVAVGDTNLTAIFVAGS